MVHPRPGTGWRSREGGSTGHHKRQPQSQVLGRSAETLGTALSCGIAICPKGRGLSLEPQTVSLWATDLRVPPARTGDQDLTPSSPRARALRTNPPTRAAYLGPQVRSGWARGDRAGALTAAQGPPDARPARVGDTHRAAGQSFPGAPAEHGRAPAARSGSLGLSQAAGRAAAWRARAASGLAVSASQPRRLGAQPPSSPCLPLSARRSLPLSRRPPPSASPRPSALPTLPSPRRPLSPSPRAPASTWGQRPASPRPALPQRLAPHLGSEVRGQDRFKAPGCCCSWGGGLRVKYF